MKAIFIVFMFFAIACVRPKNTITEDFSVSWQRQVLTRNTALGMKQVFSFSELVKIQDTESLDYIIIDNSDSVELVYIHNGTYRYLNPHHSIALLSERDANGYAYNLPHIFLDYENRKKNISFRVGICKDCKKIHGGVNG